MIRVSLGLTGVLMMGLLLVLFLVAGATIWLFDGFSGPSQTPPPKTDKKHDANRKDP